MNLLGERACHTGIFGALAVLAIAGTGSTAGSPMLVCSWMVALALFQSTIRSNRLWRFDLFFALLVGWMWFRATQLPFSYRGREDLWLIALFAAAYAAARTSPWGELRTAGLGGLALIASVLGGMLFQILSADPIAFPLPGYERVGYDNTRPGGFFNNPNQGASFLAASLILFLSTNSWTGRNRWYVILVSIAALAGIFLTKSRLGIVATAIALLVFFTIRHFLLQGHDRKWTKLACLLIVLTAMCSASLFVVVKLRPIDEGKEMRPALVDITIQQFQENPWFGTGPGGFPVYFMKNIGDSWPIYGSNLPRYAHSDTLQFAAEYGVIGVVLLFILVLSAMAISFKAKNRKYGHNVTLLCSGMITLWAVHSLADFPLRSPPNAMLLGISLGIFSAVHCPAFNSHPRGSRWPLFSAITILAVLIFVQFVNHGFAALGSKRLGKESADMAKIQRLEELAAMDPADPDRFVWIGDLWFTRGESMGKVPTVARSFYEKSRQAYQRAYEADPEKYLPAERLTLVLSRLGDFDQAGHYHEICESLAPGYYRLAINRLLLDHAILSTEENLTELRVLEDRYRRLIADLGSWPALVEGIEALRSELAD